ncbi:hypothetical protein X726_30600 [Mesorhizobium sp. L103C105A0]|nr:hypothetical protein X726_30600 [Mesorhizobium sp. L103C105A0]
MRQLKFLCSVAAVGLVWASHKKGGANPAFLSKNLFHEEFATHAAICCPHFLLVPIERQ